MNKVIISGRLTAEPMQSESGIEITKFTVAVQGKSKQQVEFIRCTAFNNIAEQTYRRLYKGVKVLITGKIHTGKYKNKEGLDVYTVEVYVNEFEILEHTQAYIESHDRQRIEESVHANTRRDYEEIIGIGKMLLYNAETVEHNSSCIEVGQIDIDKMLGEVGVDVNDLPFK